VLESWLCDSVIPKSSMYKCDLVGLRMEYTTSGAPRMALGVYGRAVGTLWGSWVACVVLGLSAHEM